MDISTLASKKRRPRPIFDHPSSANVKSILSLRRLLVYYAHVADLTVLSKWAPGLKELVIRDMKSLATKTRTRRIERLWDL